MVSTWAKLPSHLFNTQTPHSAPRCHEAKGSYKHLMWGRIRGAACCFFYSFFSSLSRVFFIQLFPVTVRRLHQTGGWRCMWPRCRYHLLLRFFNQHYFLLSTTTAMGGLICYWGPRSKGLLLDPCWPPQYWAYSRLYWTWQPCYFAQNPESEQRL